VINLIETKNGVFEITDSFRDDERNQNYFLRSLSLLFSILSILLVGFLIVSLISEFTFLILAFLIFTCLLFLLSSYLIYYFQLKLNISISGFVFYINRERDIKEMYVRTWSKGHNNQFSEKIIRYNQAIGFKIILLENEDILIDIIVDENFPGNTIFISNDQYTVSEIVKLLAIILPKAKKWYYEFEDGSVWDEDMIKEIVQDISTARAPYIIRDLYNII